MISKLTIYILLITKEVFHKSMFFNSQGNCEKNFLTYLNLRLKYMYKTFVLQEVANG